MERKYLLDIRHLSAKYPGRQDVLHDVSLHMHPGEIVCVIGESGCGKSTLLSAILRMPGKVDITQGEVLFKGQDLCRLRPEPLRRVRGAGLGMVYQEPGASLDPIRKVGVQFYEALKAHEKIARKQSDSKALDLLAKTGLSDPARVLGSCPVQLSGGMNQRVAIAMAMALEPEVLLADEPTSALDVTVQAQIVKELMKLRDEFGTAMLVVTHNMGVVAKIADKVAVMYGGRIVEYGGLKHVLAMAAHPYTRALMTAIPRLDGTPPIGVPGQKPKNFPAEGCAFASRCKNANADCFSREMKPISIGKGHWALCDMGFEGREIK